VSNNYTRGQMKKNEIKYLRQRHISESGEATLTP